MAYDCKTERTMTGLTPVCLNKGISQRVWGIPDVVNSMRFYLSLHFFVQ